MNKVWEEDDEEVDEEEEEEEEAVARSRPPQPAIPPHAEGTISRDAHVCGTEVPDHIISLTWLLAYLLWRPLKKNQ